MKLFKYKTAKPREYIELNHNVYEVCCFNETRDHDFIQL